MHECPRRLVANTVRRPGSPGSGVTICGFFANHTLPGEQRVHERAARFVEVAVHVAEAVLSARANVFMRGAREGVKAPRVVSPR